MISILFAHIMLHTKPSTTHSYHEINEPQAVNSDTVQEEKFPGLFSTAGAAEAEHCLPAMNLTC